MGASIYQPGHGLRRGNAVQYLDGRWVQAPDAWEAVVSAVSGSAQFELTTSGILENVPGPLVPGTSYFNGSAPLWKAISATSVLLFPPTAMLTQAPAVPAATITTPGTVVLDSPGGAASYESLQEHIAAGHDTYIHEQTTPATLWSIVHNLDRYPPVAVVDSGGNVVYGGVRHLGRHELEITFSAAFSGRAYLT